MKIRETLCRLDIDVDETLLQQALTHSSFANENPGSGASNERMEFLGDAVLELVVSDHLFRLEPSRDEGVLSSMRASLVREGTLASAARRLQLGPELRLGRGERAEEGERKPSLLADALEAVIAAVFLSEGLSAAHRFVAHALHLSDQSIPSPVLDAKSELEQWAQRHRNVTPCYEVVRRDGPDHDPRFTVAVSISGEVLGTGIGSSKQRAQAAAAGCALRTMERE